MHRLSLSMRAFVLCCFGMISLAAAKPMHIVHIMADDLGYDNIGLYNANKTHTPAIDNLIKRGVNLRNFHTFKICGPSRASTMTGRYPFNVGFYGDGDVQHITNFTATPQLLKRLNYSTHAIGKWDVGYVVPETTPTYKGFDTFLGYYRACNNDLFYHTTGGCNAYPVPPGQVLVDMSKNRGSMIGGARGLNGSYSTRVFSEHAVDLIRNHDHDRPLYMYIAPQNVHLACGTKQSKLVQGIQAPCETTDIYPFAVNDTFGAQSAVTTELDYLVGNVSAALESTGLWDDTVVVFTSDNGGPLDHTTNFPLRGGKHTFWEGGIRVLAAVSGGAIRAEQQGTSFHGIAHSSDWYRTLVEGVAGGSIPHNTGPMPPDSFNLWPALTTGSPSPRKEVIHQVQNKHFSEGVIAIRVGDMKLIVGPPGDARWLKWPELDSKPRTFGDTGGVIRQSDQCLAGINTADKDTSVHCKEGCLFNLSSDPEERINLIHDSKYTTIVQQMKEKLNVAGQMAPPPSSYFSDPTPALNAICKSEVESGFLEPLGI